MSDLTRVVLAIAISFVLTLIIGRFLIPMLRALKAGQSILEIGPNWHASKNGTPVMGGIMFIVSSLVMCVLLGWEGIQHGDFAQLTVFGMAFCFGLIGFADDLCKVKFKRNLGLTSLQKSALQMIVSGVFLYFMYRSGHMSTELYVPFFNITWHIHPMVYILFAMFVMVGCVNAVNLTDGVDGLSSSVTIPVMVFFTVVCCAAGKWNLALLPACLIGGLCAYLIYNFHPAKVFMGDTGSLFLGGVVCGMAFAVDMPLILLLVGFVYICETLSVIMQVTYFKVTHGKRIFKMAPIHHHFEMCGWKEEKVVAVFASVSIVMCVIAWFAVAGRYGM